MRAEITSIQWLGFALTEAIVFYGLVAGCSPMCSKPGWVDDFRHRYLDVALIALAAPILLLAGIPAAGYGIGAATWIVLRGLGGVLHRSALSSGELSQLVALTVGYRFARVALLVPAVVLAEKLLGKQGVVTTLGVITFAFTVSSAGWSFITSSFGLSLVRPTPMAAIHDQPKA
jgi:hypothetical protein